LDTDILEILSKAKIDSIDMVFNLTDSDLDNLKFSKEQKDSLEKYLEKYLNKKEK